MVNQRLIRDFNETVLKSMDLNLKNILSRLEIRLLVHIDEIRLRVNKPLMVCTGNEDFFVDKSGKLVKDPSKAYLVKEVEIRNTLSLLSNYSIYSIEEELAKGYITLKGGHRVGITGRAVVERGHIKTMKYINGLNFRIMREVKGCSNKILREVLKNKNEVYHTLIAGPPKSGKTTILRDLVRSLSNGDINNKGFKIGVVDERSEIAGCYLGIPQNDIGIRTDVLDCCPKAEGIINIIRSMSPEIIVTDEIGSKEDGLAISEALNAGIKIITTVHGGSLEELLHRPNISQMIKDKLFEKIIFIDNKPKVGTLSNIVYTRDLEQGVKDVS